MERTTDLEKTVIHRASAEDAEEILAIYGPYVKKTAITLEYDIPTLQDFRERIENTLARYPYLVATCNGVIIGYAYAGPFHPRAAYQHSAELSIYLLHAVARDLEKSCTVHWKESFFPSTCITWKPASPGPERTIPMFPGQVPCSMNIWDFGWLAVSPNADTSSDDGMTWYGWKNLSETVRSTRSLSFLIPNLGRNKPANCGLSSCCIMR